MHDSRPVDPRRGLPAIGRLLREPQVEDLARLYGTEAVAEALRSAVDAARAGAGPAESWAGAEAPGTSSVEALIDRAAAALRQRFGAPPRRVLNATGILLHTNLGRAPLSVDVAAELARLAAGYTDLELDLESGRRGQRGRAVSSLLHALCSAEAALVANNAAAALLLSVAELTGSPLARGREVVVSRGELVEIGGSFRLPAILRAAGATLVEVGTTNRTRIEDYRAAISPATGLLLRVHQSNFAIHGFTAQPTVAELVALGREHSLPLVVDEGAGRLRGGSGHGGSDHPSVAKLLAHGVDLVISSGDKLLGGPQAGLVMGRHELVERCRRNPLFRALRPGKLPLIALELVLRERLAGVAGPAASLEPEPELHRCRVVACARAVGGAVVEAAAQPGGGSGATSGVVGPVVGLPATRDLAGALRRGSPPVVGYVQAGQLLLDLRTVDPADESALVDAVRRARTSLGSTP